MAALTPYFKACLSRALFLAHASFTIWRLVVIKENLYWWLFTLSYTLLVLETILTLAKRQGYDTKWFIPSVFLYICCEVPPIWLMELDRLRDYRGGFPPTSNGSRTGFNETEDVTYEEDTALEDDLVLDDSLWVLTLEQTFLFVLIIARWFMPSRTTTQDELSQLLFVYIGVMSDIMEILLLFGEPEILATVVMPKIVMAIWTVSLLQFCFVQTSAQRPGKEGCCRCQCCQTEIWSLCTSLALQDVPFVILRMYSILYLGVMNYTILFFTCKNGLVITLQIYRMGVVIQGLQHEKGAMGPSSMDKSAIVEMEIIHQNGNGRVGGNETPTTNASEQFTYTTEDNFAVSGGIVNSVFEPNPELIPSANITQPDDTPNSTGVNISL